jgi:hypothetical protein
MSKADLHRKYADALDLCEKHGIDEFCAVRYKGNYVPASYFKDIASDYTFPVAVIEGKPVFLGDELYESSGYKITVTNGEALMADSLALNYSWNPPKPKTFTLNGVEFEAPSKQRTSEKQYHFSFLGVSYFFKDSKAGIDFLTCLQILLNGEQDKS